MSRVRLSFFARVSTGTHAWIIIHHNYTLGAELHFEQNCTLRSRTTLSAKLHFEQNSTQNSNFMAKCKIPNNHNILIHNCFIMICKPHHLLHESRNGTNRSIQLLETLPRKQSVMPIKRINVVSQSYHCISQSVIVTSNHTSTNQISHALLVSQSVITISH